MASRGRRVGMIFIVLALILVVILGAAAYFGKEFFFPSPVVAPLPTAEAPAVKTVDIVVLTQNVSFGGTITEAALGFAPIPADRYVEGLYFKTKEQVKGRRARYQMQSGTILTTGMLSDNSVGSYASSQIPKGMVAISIPISELTSVSYALQPGDHVSVLVALLLEELDPNFQSKLPNTTANVYKPGTAAVEKDGVVSPPSLTLTINSNGEGSTQGRTELDPVLNQPVYVQGSEAQRPRVVTQMLVSDAMVLGVGRFPLDGSPSGSATATPTPAPAAAAAGGPTPTPAPAPAIKVPEVITLVVSPQDAITLNYILLNRGAKLNLALRSAGDDTKVDKTESVTLQFLMDQYNIPFPSKLPYGLEPCVRSLDYTGTAGCTTGAPVTSPVK
jgi:Flp pilus assembly protein CpaB